MKQINKYIKFENDNKLIVNCSHRRCILNAKYNNQNIICIRKYHFLNKNYKYTYNYNYKCNHKRCILNAKYYNQNLICIRKYK